MDATVEQAPVDKVVRWPSRLVQAIGDRVSRLTAWQVTLAAVIALWTAYFTTVTLEVHHGLGTSAYDYGLYDQGIWLMSRFEAPFVTLMGRNLMGDHASFILILMVPLFWLFPSAGTLFFVQSLFIALGALPVFLLARRMLGSEAIGVLLAVCYLLHPAVAWTNRENFHPDFFLGFFVGMAIYGAIERKWRLYVVFAVLSLLVKEDVSLVLIPVGVWVALKRDRRIGLATIAGSLAMMAFGMLVVMRNLIGVPTRNGWRIPFGGPSGVIRESIERPGNVIEHFRSDGRPFYFWQMTAPFAFIAARAPSVALISLGVLASNMLSTFWYQYQIEYHYSLVPVAALALGTVWALSHIHGRARRWCLSAVAVMTVWTCLMWGAVPIGKLVMPWSADPIGREMPYSWPSTHPVAEAARDIIADIPDDAVVSAQYTITAQLARRKQIYMFPNPFRAVLYGPNTDLEAARARLPAADDVEFVVLPQQLDAANQADWDAVSDDFEVLDQNQYWVVYQRVTP
jgi:uncharacterized membrane protein